MNDEREKMIEIAWAGIAPLKGDVTTSDMVEAAIDALIAAGYGDVAKARAEMAIGLASMFERVTAELVAEIRALAKQKEPSDE